MSAVMNPTIKKFSLIEFYKNIKTKPDPEPGVPYQLVESYFRISLLGRIKLFIETPKKFNILPEKLPKPVFDFELPEYLRLGLEHPTPAGLPENSLYMREKKEFEIIANHIEFVATGEHIAAYMLYNKRLNLRRKIINNTLEQLSKGVVLFYLLFFMVMFFPKTVTCFNNAVTVACFQYKDYYDNNIEQYKIDNSPYVNKTIRLKNGIQYTVRIKYIHLDKYETMLSDTVTNDNVVKVTSDKYDSYSEGNIVKKPPLEHYDSFLKNKIIYYDDYNIG